jgi:hypothetical protein
MRKPGGNFGGVNHPVRVIHAVGRLDTFLFRMRTPRDC